MVRAMDTARKSTGGFRRYLAIPPKRRVTDMLLIAEGKKIRIDIDVVSEASEVWKTMLEKSDTTEIVLEDITYEAAKLLVEYLHTKFLGFPKAMILIELMAAADRYKIESMKEQCSDILMRVIKLDDAIDVLKSAEKLNQDEFSEELIEKLLDYLRQNKSRIVKTDAYKALDSCSKKELREKWSAKPEED